MTNPVLEGLIAGYQTRNMLQQTQMDQRRLEMQQKQFEQQQAMQDLQTLMTLATAARPVQGGTVQDEAVVPDGAGAMAGAKVPIARKADAGRTVKWKGQQFELLTPEEQAARARSVRVDDARAMIPVQKEGATAEVMGRAEGDQAVRKQYGMAPGAALSEYFPGLPQGTLLTPAEILNASERAGNYARAEKVAKLQADSAANVANIQANARSKEGDANRQSRERVAKIGAAARMASSVVGGRAGAQANAQLRFVERQVDSLTKEADKEAATEQKLHKAKLEAGQDTKLTEAAREMKLKALDGQIQESQRRQKALFTRREQYNRQLSGGADTGGGDGGGDGAQYDYVPGKGLVRR